LGTALRTGLAEVRRTEPSGAVWSCVAKDFERKRRGRVVGFRLPVAEIGMLAAIVLGAGLASYSVRVVLSGSRAVEPAARQVPVIVVGLSWQEAAIQPEEPTLRDRRVPGLSLLDRRRIDERLRRGEAPFYPRCEAYHDGACPSSRPNDLTPAGIFAPLGRTPHSVTHADEHARLTARAGSRSTASPRA